LRTDKNNNFKFTIKFLMTLDRSYIGYLGFLGIDLFKSVLMYSNGAICLIKLLFDLGLFTVHKQHGGSVRMSLYISSMVKPQPLLKAGSTNKYLPPCAPLRFSLHTYNPPFFLVSLSLVYSKIRRNWMTCHKCPILKFD